MPLKLKEIFSEEELSTRLDALSKATGLELNSFEFLQALTHRSYVYSDESIPVEDNERLEFLGDSISNSLVTQYLYLNFPDWDEGRLSQAKSILVSCGVYADCARQLNLGDFLYLSQTEEGAKAFEKDSVLEDAFEAFMGAVYLNLGLESCEGILKQVLYPKVETHLNNPHLLNGKSMLMEYLQKLALPLPEYQVLEEYGLEHEKTFVIEVKVGKLTLAKGRGPSKKKVEKQIALESYNMLMNHPELLENVK